MNDLSLGIPYHKIAFRLVPQRRTDQFLYAAGQVVQTRHVAASVRTTPLPVDPGEFLLYLNSVLAKHPMLWILAAVSGLFLFACVTWVGLKLQERFR